MAERLAAIPEVLEVHTITGVGDLLCRVVARGNADLQRVLDAIVSVEGVVRSATVISLAAQVPYRVLPLVRAAATPLDRYFHPTTALLCMSWIRNFATFGYYGERQPSCASRLPCGQPMSRAMASSRRDWSDGCEESEREPVVT